jgi:hypothetical protein
MTREERERRLLAEFAEVKAKYPDLGAHAFAAFCAGWVAGHALGCEEASEMMTEQAKRVVERAMPAPESKP